jgi:DeoR/GlpR family transcriptional regulator of sugar metabolism
MATMDPSESRTASARRANIVRALADGRHVRVADLVEQFGVTDTSIRRDLALLEAEGLLRRVHGGAIGLQDDARGRRYGEKLQHHLAEKRRIGAAAAERVRPGDVVILNSGTTTLQVAASIPTHLREASGLTLVTNSLPIAEQVRSWAAPNLIMLGGLYLADEQATVGPQTLGQLRSISADWAFLGADGITLEDSLTSGHVLMADVDRLMAERARQVVVTVDSSKVGHSGLVHVLDLGLIHMLITDAAADADLLESFRQKGVEVVLA